MNLKDKKLPLVAGGAAIIVILLLLIFMPSKKEEGGPEVISKRVKIEVPDASAPLDSTTDAATSTDANVAPMPAPTAHVAAPAVQAPLPVPAPAVKPAPIQPKAEVKPAPIAPKRVEEPVKAVAKAPVEKKVEETPAPKTAKAEKKKTAEKSKKVAEVSKRLLARDAWVLNIASFPSLSEAQNLAGKLKKGGYNSYISKFTKDSVEWHRVRVGFFASREEATKTGKSIKTKFNVDTPWVAKPDTAEARAHM